MSRPALLAAGRLVDQHDEKVACTQRLQPDLDSLAQALARRINEVRPTTAVGAEMRREITRAISDVGMPANASRVWAVTERRAIGGGLNVGRLVVPLHLRGIKRNS